MGLDHPLDQTEPRPIPMDLRGYHLCATIEWFEDVFLVALRDTHAAIRTGDLDFRFTTSDEFGRHAEPTTGRAIFHCVPDQILERLP